MYNTPKVEREDGIAWLQSLIFLLFSNAVELFCLRRIRRHHRAHLDIDHIRYSSFSGEQEGS